jgi:hypothetical protein
MKVELQSSVDQKDAGQISLLCGKGVTLDLDVTFYVKINFNLVVDFNIKVKHKSLCITKYKISLCLCMRQQKFLNKEP